MGFNNKLFKNPFSGLGLDLYYEEQPYTSTNGASQYSDDSKKVGEYQKDQNYDIIRYSILSKKKEGEDTGFFVESSLNVNNNELLNKTSLIDIILYLQKWKSTYVEFADFAYLKNLGVFPTNRLIIARRFSSPTPNNLYKVKESPISTLISWLPDGENFLSVSFGEEWIDVQDTSITDILSDFARDFAFKKDIAQTKFGGGLDVLPLPGLTEGLQENIRKQLGLSPDKDPEYNKYNLPAGNPNLIREASRRGLVSADRNGSGLRGRFQIKFATEYELKFINGVDPSLVYLDIIQNALVFGTSKSINILNTSVENTTNDALKSLLSGDFKQVSKVLGDVIKGIGEFLKTKYDEYQDKVKKKGVSATAGEFFTELGKDVITFELSKYRVRLIGVLQMLTGAPSGYFHVTIGNPKKPILSSGDMICSSVTLTLGPVLSYNDLPSTIKIEFELSSARNLGGQEIFDRLNTGQSRTYFQPKRSYFDEFFGGTPSGGGTNEQSTKPRKDRFIEYTREALGKNDKENPGPGVGSGFITTPAMQVQPPQNETQGSTNQV